MNDTIYTPKIGEKEVREAARILKDGGEVKTGDDLGAVGYEDVVVDGKVIYGKAWLDFTVDNYKDDPYITG